MSLQTTIIKDLKDIESDLGCPTFTWQGNTYNFIPSITDYQRELETGGYQMVKLITATVRKYEIDDFDNITALFPTMPIPQQIITYNLDNTNFRIESVKVDPTNSYFRLIGHSTTRGA